jgi:hypothetical protein
MNVSVVSIFWIRRDDYGRFLDICSDADQLPPTYEKWLYRTDKHLKRLTRRGREIIKVEVDLDEFVAWCRSKGLNVDGNARSEYANVVAAVQVMARDENKH